LGISEDRKVTVPPHPIRATYTSDTITVYQAYSAEIADPAVSAGRFVPPFRRDRMTWIKPSFLWMMLKVYPLPTNLGAVIGASLPAVES
jgi:hypothetical protein